MTNTYILLPMVAMAFWTFGITFYLGRIRFRAVRNKELSLSYFRNNKAEEVPENVTTAIQHYNNLFELNSLFYIASITLYVTNLSSFAMTVLTWAYVVSRIAHSIVHLGSNDVQRRFLVFMISFVILMLLWVRILVGIVI